MFRKPKRSASERSASKTHRDSPLSNRRALAQKRRLVFEALEDKRMLSFTWSGGGGGDTQWSLPANWAGNMAPGNGASLIFSGTQTSTYNDLSGMTFNSIELSSSNFMLAGNSIVLSSGITVDSGVTGGVISLNIAEPPAGAISLNLTGSSSTLAISGVISGTGNLTELGGGSLTLTRANTYTGPTTVSAGTLTAAAVNTVPTASAVTVASGATFVLNGYSQSIGSLTGAGIVTNNSFAAVTLTVGNDGTSPAAFSKHTISDTTGSNTGSLSLVKLGTGTLTLIGASTYSGSTAIQNGELLTGVSNNCLPQGTSVTLGSGSNGGILKLGQHGLGATNQTLAGIFTTGTGASSVMGLGPSLTLNVSGSDTFGAVIGGSLALVKNGAGTLNLTGTNSYDRATTINAGTLNINSDAALGAPGNGLIFAGNSTLQFAAGMTLNSSRSIGVASNVTATLDTLGHSVSFAGVVSSSGSLLVTSSTGAGTLTLSGVNTNTGGTTVTSGTLDVAGTLGPGPVTANGGTLYVTGSLGSGPVAVNSGTLDVAGSDTSNSGNLSLSSSSTYVAELTNTGGGQINATGTVNLGGATLSVNNSAVTNTNGGIWVLIKNDGTDAVTGNFIVNGVPIYDASTTFTVGTTKYFIDYDYNADTGTFGTGNDVALCSALVSALAAPSNPHIVAAAYPTIIDRNVRDATEHKETWTSEQDATQYQLPTPATITNANYTAGYFSTISTLLSPSWPAIGQFTVSYQSENTSIALVNSSTGLVTFQASGTCDILLTVTGGGTNTLFPLQANLAIPLTGVVTTPTTTTLVDQFTPYSLNSQGVNVGFYAPSNLLVLYNASLPASVALKDYYLANRPGVSGANLLGITGMAVPTTANDFGHTDINGNDEAQILSQLNTWAASNPTLASTIRSVVMLAGLPSTVIVGSEDPSIPDAINTDNTAWGSASSTYMGADQFTVAEYGHPLVAMLDAGDNALSVSGLTLTNASGANSYSVQSYNFGAQSAFQYVDSFATFSAPGQFLGSTYIQTANANNASTTFSLSIPTNTATNVYVLFDSAITTVPSWLTTSFTKLTGPNSTITNSDTHVFNIYKSTSIYAAGSVISLGANDGFGGSSPSEMYTVLLAPIADPSVASSQVADWRLDEGTGSVVNDTATGGSYADNGTATNGPGWATGHVGNALSLNGVNQSVVVSNANSDLNLTGSQISLVAWAQSGTSTWSSSDSFVSYGSYSLGGVNGSNNIEFRLDLGGVWQTLTYTNPNSITGWHQYAATYNGSTMSLYVDGSFVKSLAATGSISSASGPLYLGQNSASGYLNGSLDEVQIYNAALGASDIAAIYNEPPPNLGAFVQNFSFGAAGVSQYGDQSYGFSSYPSQYANSTFVQTLNSDNQNANFSLSLAMDTGGNLNGQTVVYESAATTVDVLYDNAITTKPSWLTNSFTSTGQTVTNSNGHHFTVYQSNSAYGPRSTINLGANGGNSGSEMYSVLLVSPYVQTEAYINKEVAAANANSKAGLGADGTSINGGAAGVAGSNFILDSVDGPGNYTGAVAAIAAADSVDTLNSSTNPTGNIYSQTITGGPDIDVPSDTGAALTGYWRLDEGTGGTAYDTATGGSVADNGTISGSPAWLTSSSSHIGNALQFNGTSQYVTVNSSNDLNQSLGLTLASWATSSQSKWSSSDSFIS